MKVFASCSKKTVCSLPTEVIVLSPNMSDGEMAKEFASKIKEHYLTEKILQKWGRPKIAAYIARKTPTSMRGKSGDLGEILATEYINAGYLPFVVPINRLRWKDTRDLPMRGEDVLGFAFDAKPLRFLKGEAKSGKKITEAVVAAARKALNKNSGLPLPHTLCFIMERLFEMNQDTKAELIEEYVDNKLPDQSQVAHFIFTFSQNDPAELLELDAKNAKKTITHHAVGLCVARHQELINAVFTQANNA
jgi:hypothetical protein